MRGKEIVYFSDNYEDDIPDDYGSDPHSNSYNPNSGRGKFVLIAIIAFIAFLLLASLYQNVFQQE